MSWQAVVRNDLRMSIRSTGIWALALLFLLCLGGLAYAVAELAQPDFDAFLEVTSVVVALLLPLVGIVLGYEAVVPERESGSLVLALAMPNSRSDVVVGKLLGRAAVLTGPFVVGTIGAALVALLQYSSFAPLRYALFMLTALVYGLVFVAIAGALSMALSSSRRVIGGAFGAYVLLVMFWNELVNVLVVILFRFQPTALVDVPLWAESLKFLNPRTTFVYLVAETLDVGSGAAALETGGQSFDSPIVAVLVLFTWVVVPVALGYVGFERAEL